MRHCDYIAFTGCPQKDACISSVIRAVSPRGGDRRRDAEEWIHRRELPSRTRVRRAVAPPSQDDCRSGTASVHPRRGARHRLPCLRRAHSEPASVSGHAARSTLITQLSRSLVLINALGTTGILIPKALNAARMRAAWIASIHAIPASSSIMYGDFNFAASLTYPTAAPISSASASLAMLTSLSTLP